LKSNLAWSYTASCSSLEGTPEEKDPMLEVNIPGYRTLVFSFLVLDYNGTIARDGRLITGVRGRLEALSKSVKIHILTADTFGSVRKAMAGIPCEVVVIGKENQTPSPEVDRHSSLVKQGSGYYPSLDRTG
jgi:hypothetical protein